MFFNGGHLGRVYLANYAKGLFEAFDSIYFGNFNFSVENAIFPYFLQ